MMRRMREGTITQDYKDAIAGEGRNDFFSLCYEWEDKPHLLVLDLCGEVDYLKTKAGYWKVVADLWCGFCKDLVKDDPEKFKDLQERVKKVFDGSV